MSAMERNLRRAVLPVLMVPFVCAASATHALGQDIQQHLRDQLQGKTFVLRTFPAGDALHYDASGVLDSSAPGNWTTDGFVHVNEVLLSDRLLIKAQRMVVARLDGGFQLRRLERTKGPFKRKELARVEITADLSAPNLSTEQIDALVSKIFLTSQDTFEDLVPGYWRPCVKAGLRRTEKNCIFGPEVLAIPGLAPGNGVCPDDVLVSGVLKGSGGPSGPGTGLFHVSSSVSPPRPTYHPDPKFSEPARTANYRGVTVLRLVVNREGVPTNIRISQPLGYGLDENAVKAVETWRFMPAEKDGQPVAVEIAVEVEFHLY